MREVDARVVMAYCRYCDDNNIRRIDATREQRIDTIDRMIRDLFEWKWQIEKEIASRCLRCGAEVDHQRLKSSAEQSMSNPAPAATI